MPLVWRQKKPTRLSHLCLSSPTPTFRASLNTCLATVDKYVYFNQSFADFELLQRSNARTKISFVLQSFCSFFLTNPPGHDTGFHLKKKKLSSFTSNTRFPTPVESQIAPQQLIYAHFATIGSAQRHLFHVLVVVGLRFYSIKKHPPQILVFLC